MKRIVAIALAAVLLCLALVGLTGCGKKETTELTFVKRYDGEKYYNKVECNIDVFSKKSVGSYPIILKMDNDENENKAIEVSATLTVNKHYINGEYIFVYTIMAGSDVFSYVEEEYVFEKVSGYHPISLSMNK